MARKATEKPRKLGWLTIAAVVAIVAGAGVYFVKSSLESAAGAAPARAFVHIHGLGIDPQTPEIVWLSTHEGLIRIADNDWQYVGKTRPDLMGFTVAPAEPGVFYSSGHPGQGINLPNPVGLVVSRDRGQTWQPISLTGKVDFHAMTVSAADPRLVYGWFGKLYRSEDGGKAWKEHSPSALSGGVYQLVAHPGERSHLLAGTDQGLFLSKDFGESWETLLPGTVTSAAYAPAEPKQIVAYQPSRGLLHSLDGGRNWQELGFKTASGDAVAYIAIHPKDARIMYIATFKANLLQTENGGSTWREMAHEGKVLRR